MLPVGMVVNDTSGLFEVSIWGVAAPLDVH
jgi:hypothetical protein